MRAACALPACTPARIDLQEPLPEGIEPLVLWAPPEGSGAAASEAITVDPMLVRFLRPHQREGVQFMFECVTGLRLETGRGARSGPLGALRALRRVGALRTWAGRGAAVQQQLWGMQ